MNAQDAPGNDGQEAERCVKQLSVDGRKVIKRYVNFRRKFPRESIVCHGKSRLSGQSAAGSMALQRQARLIFRIPDPGRPASVICRRCYSAAVPKSEPQRERRSAEDVKEPGAMQRRLEDLAETAQPLADDPRAGVSSTSTITDVDLLKLQDRIAKASFNQAYPRADGQHTMPTSADKLTRNIAADTPWTGEERTHDSVLRMLTDKHKPLRIPSPKPTLSSLPLKGARKPMSPKTSMDRALAAKEASQGYSLLKEKLSPGFSAMPATMEGLASLAEERIQHARARGEFQSLPGRGKPAPKDHLDDSPYLDRTGMLYR